MSKNIEVWSDYDRTGQWRMNIRKKRGKLKIGDTIQCADADDMIDAMVELAKGGVDTDFLYERDGQKGLWLVVTGLEEG